MDVEYDLLHAVQALALMYDKRGRSFGDLKPEKLMMVGKVLKLVDFSSSLVQDQSMIIYDMLFHGYDVQSCMLRQLGHDL